MISTEKQMSNKERFVDILRTYCSHRFDVDEFVKYLTNETDFFQAPASTKFHLCVNGGLLQHSLHVFDELEMLCMWHYEDVDKSSVAICGLLHDICKTNFYKLDTRNVKVDGKWISQLCYTISDSLPLGHGEKSVMMLLRKMNLTNEEMLAIRWHMNGFDYAVKGGEQAMMNATGKTKLITLLQVADLIAANIIEGD